MDRKPIVCSALQKKGAKKTTKKEQAIPGGMGNFDTVLRRRALSSCSAIARARGCQLEDFFDSGSEKKRKNQERNVHLSVFVSVFILIPEMPLSLSSLFMFILIPRNTPLFDGPILVLEDVNSKYIFLSFFLCLS